MACMVVKIALWGCVRKTERKKKMEGMFILDAMNGLHGGDDRTLGMREENRKKKEDGRYVHTGCCEWPAWW